MIEYRLYRRDGAGRILTAPELIVADDDQEAVLRARELLALPCEIWQESRLVAVVDPQRAAS
jgi:hypothetical protein